MELRVQCFEDIVIWQQHTLEPNLYDVSRGSGVTATMKYFNVLQRYHIISKHVLHLV